MAKDLSQEEISERRAARELKQSADAERRRALRDLRERLDDLSRLELDRRGVLCRGPAAIDELEARIHDLRVRQHAIAARLKRAPEDLRRIESARKRIYARIAKLELDPLVTRLEKLMEAEAQIRRRLDGGDDDAR